MKNTFNDPIRTDERREYTALEKNPNAIHYYGVDEHVALTRDPETGVIHEKADFYHTDKNGKRHNEITERDVPETEMTSEQFDTARDALMNITHEQTLVAENEHRHFGFTSDGMVQTGEDSDGNKSYMGKIDLFGDDHIDNDTEFQPFRSVPNARRILEEAGLSAKEYERWNAYEVDGKKQREIAEAEGVNQKTVSDTLKTARAKIAKGVSDYVDEINGRGSTFEAQARYATRKACEGCKHWDKATDTCMKHGYSEIDEATGEEVEKHRSIYEAFEEHSGATVKSNGKGGFDYVGGTCYDFPFEDDGALADLMGTTRESAWVYTKPNTGAIRTKEDVEAEKAMNAQNKEANKMFMETIARWKSENPEAFKTPNTKPVDDYDEEAEEKKRAHWGAEAYENPEPYTFGASGDDYDEDTDNPDEDGVPEGFHIWNGDEPLDD